MRTDGALRGGLRALGACGALIVAAACGAPAPPADNDAAPLRVALWQSFPTLDWQSSVSHPIPDAMLQVYEGLFALGKDFTPVPELAERAEAVDGGRVWVVRLYEGVRFHDGTTMTADDVRASIERWRRVSPRGVMLSELSAIEVVDPLTLRFVFERPLGAYFTLLLAEDEAKAIVMPRAIAEAATRPGSVHDIVGTGPYRVAEYRPDQFLRLERFDGYVPRGTAGAYQGGRKQVHAASIVFSIVPEASTRVAGLEAGEYDIAARVPDVEYERLRDLPDIEPVVVAPAMLDYLVLNHRSGPLTDVRLRRAVQAAIDVEAVNRSMVVSEVFWVMNPSIFPPESPFHSEEARELFSQADPARARALLAEAGYRGEPLKFLVLREEPTIYRASIAVAEHLRAGGFTIDLQVLDLATWVARRAVPAQMDMFIASGYWRDPSHFHGEFGGRFPGWFTTPETEAVFAQLRVELDPQRRVQLGRQLQRLFYERVAFVNVGSHYGLRAHRAGVADPEGNLGRGNLTLHGLLRSPAQAPAQATGGH